MLKKLLFLAVLVLAVGAVLDGTGWMPLPRGSVDGDLAALLPIPRARSPLGPLAWTTALSAVVYVTLPRRRRAGFWDTMGDPAFSAASTFASAGFYLLNMIPARGFLRVVLNALALPLPDWDQLLLGAGFPANPLFYSALIPLVLAPFGVRFKALRWPMAGIACGFAGTLGYTAWLGSPPLVGIGESWLAQIWLAGHALLALFLARGILMRELK